MKISGQEIAEHMLQQLRQRVEILQKKNVMPHLVVIFVGEDPASAAYIKQKQKQGERIGAKVTVLNYNPKITTVELAAKIQLLNTDPYVHGILIQRPLPEHIDIAKITNLTDPQKDVDGFNPQSPYTLPLPLAVEKILEEIFQKQTAQGVAGVGDPHRAPAANARTSDGGNSRQDPDGMQKWLRTHTILILGKGETAGKPIKDYFTKLGIITHVIDSKTQNTETLMQQADIIISAVGKAAIIKPQLLKPTAILIGVGMTKGEGKKLHGDYDEEAVQENVAYYTPTPGGVGPVNVAMLMENLVTATEKQNP